VRRIASISLLALALALLVAAPAGATQSTKLGKHLCQTSGGGAFVDIPEFPGERIDRRLLTDLRWLEARFKIIVVDGYSTSKVHERTGEHPIGLAADILPDFDAGGSWQLVSKLARWAEPRQNQPRSPFRWVGYWKDKGHGPRDHLHLSWSHTPVAPKHPAHTVWTIRCPGTGS
jgi:hypothetical protein